MLLLSNPATCGGHLEGWFRCNRLRASSCWRRPQVLWYPYVRAGRAEVLPRTISVERQLSLLIAPPFHWAWRQ